MKRLVAFSRWLDRITDWIGVGLFVGAFLAIFSGFPVAFALGGVSLIFAVVFVGALLAAATGVVGASVVAMGLISLPVMRRYGYSTELSAGVIAASGTLGQIYRGVLPFIAIQIAALVLIMLFPELVTGLLD